LAQALRERNALMLFNGELGNGDYDALLPAEKKRG
jgi:hypothetical protein